MNNKKRRKRGDKNRNRFCILGSAPRERSSETISTLRRAAALINNVSPFSL